MNLAWRKAVRDSSDRRIDSSAVAVAFALDTYANKDGLCWPSRATIAAGAKLTDKPVDQAIRRLEAVGFLVVSRSRGRTSHTYRLTLPNHGAAPQLTAPATMEQLRSNYGADDPVTTELATSNGGVAPYEAGSNRSKNRGSKPAPATAEESQALEPATENWFAQHYDRTLGHVLKDVPS